MGCGCGFGPESVAGVSDGIVLPVQSFLLFEVVVDEEGALWVRFCPTNGEVIIAGEVKLVDVPGAMVTIGCDSSRFSVGLLDTTLF